MQIRLTRAGVDDAEMIWKMQIKSFVQLLDRYQDMETNPANELLEKTILRLEQSFTYFYLIQADGRTVGAIRVVDRMNGENKRISPIFILPEYRNQGIAQNAILCAEERHGRYGWELETILQEKGNCYLYEKLGYRATGKVKTTVSGHNSGDRNILPICSLSKSQLPRSPYAYGIRKHTKHKKCRIIVNFGKNVQKK